MHDLHMPRRTMRSPLAPARPLTGLLLVARLNGKDNSPGVGKLLDRDAAESIARRADQAQDLTQEAK